ncbi:MAG TPA: DUF5686 family protein [Bacteroidia bacterium]|nr:DUF5686 family protein [Bacteroidia bacterium]HRG53060.1 DUF5686 family protein [Bacteroidia bacterium]
MKFKKKFFFLFFFALTTIVRAQQKTVISGRVTEAVTNSGVPFANIYFKGGTIGTVTDFEGNYVIETTTIHDSIYVSLIGYRSKAKAIKNGKTQLINFQIATEALNLASVEVKPGVNPAVRIIKNAISKKSDYNRDNLKSVQFISYTKQEADIDNITPRMRKRKFLNDITRMWDKMDTLAGPDSKANLPVFMSEIISEIYTSNDGKKKREDVKAIKARFVGMKDGSAIGQLTGSDFQNYNFCNNNVAIQGKDFLSPIADNALSFYNYYLIDSMVIDSFKCYQIDCRPKNKRDLAYTGMIWITDSTYAIKQLDLGITKEVNFNLVDRARIQQILIPTAAGPWVPVQTRVMIDYAALTEKLVSMILRVYNCNEHYIVNQPKENNFFETKTSYAEDALTKDSTYWITNRPEALTPLEAESFNMIDSVRSIPVIKHAVNTLYFLFSGYQDIGPIDIGNYTNLYAYNNYEGSRVRLGFRTNAKFSKNWIIRGYGAYGFKDKGFKYNLQLERIITRFPWSKAGIQYRSDIDQIGTNYAYSTNISLGQTPNNLNNTFSHIGNVSKLVYKRESRVWFEKDFNRGLNAKLTLQNTRTTPLYPVEFGDQFSLFQTSKFSITELLVDTRYSLKERFIQNGTERISFGNNRSPVISLNYTWGIKKLFDGDFSYHKVNVSVSNRFRMAVLGYSQVLVKGGKVFSEIPYTLLEIPRGNESYFWGNNIFNKMNFFEFVSDQYVQGFWQHHFNGLLFNRVPLIKRLNIREVIGGNIAYGTLSSKNQTFNENNAYTVMTTTPYAEVSAGIENILNIIRIDYVYRLTYTDAAYKRSYAAQNPGNSITNWGIRVGLQFNF